ncbi:MAG: hypothetical protein P4L46_21970 [Fimbriimonas sp.]|nr:hypothetical protein [Fimbriimonas sp.]
MAMVALLIVSCLAGQFEFSRWANPTHLPLTTKPQLSIHALLGARPRDVIVNVMRWQHGYRPIVWKYVLDLPFNQAAVAIGKELSVEPFEPGVPMDLATLNTPNVGFSRDRNGITQTIQLSRGVQGRTALESTESRVTVRVSEAVSEAGPLPTYWPDKPCQAPGLDCPVPWMGSGGNVQSVSWDLTPIGSRQYFFNFRFDEPYSNVLDRVHRRLDALGYRCTVRDGHADFRKSGSGIYVWVDVDATKKPGDGGPTITFSICRNEPPGMKPGPWGG